jgi:hypothetical protein
MTGTPRAPWTPEQDKELRALVLSANSVHYCQGSKPDHFCGTPPGKHTEASIEKDCEAPQTDLIRRSSSSD